MKFDEFVKSRSPGESLAPVPSAAGLIFLDSGFRRNDENELSATIYETIRYGSRLSVLLVIPATKEILRNIKND